MSTFSHNKIEFAYWGDNNRYPEDALQIVGKTGVLSTALNYKCRCCYGQGVVPMTLTSIDENNKEIFAPVNDKEILKGTSKN